MKDIHPKGNILAELRVLIAGGGTGGHIIPALAVARELVARHSAEVLFVGTARGMGFKVSGSDLRRGPVTDRLAQLGATVCEGHNARNVSGATVVVTSSAVSPNNPEVLEARARKIPVIQRAEMLAELMRLKYSIAIAGMTRVFASRAQAIFRPRAWCK